MTTKTLSAVEKADEAYVEDASKAERDLEQEVAVREFDPKFMRRTMIKVPCSCYLPVGLYANFYSWT